MKLMLILSLAALAYANPANYGFSSNQWNPVSTQVLAGSAQQASQFPLQNLYYQQVQPSGRDLYSVVPVQNQYYPYTSYPFTANARDLSGTTGTVTARQMHQLPGSNFHQTPSMTSFAGSVEPPVGRNILTNTFTDNTAFPNRNFPVQDKTIIPTLLSGIDKASQDIRTNPDTIKVLGKDATITMISHDDGSSVLLINGTHGKTAAQDYLKWVDQQQTINTTTTGTTVGQDTQTIFQFPTSNNNIWTNTGDATWKPSAQSVISALTTPTDTFQPATSNTGFQSAQFANENIKNVDTSINTNTKPIFAVSAGPIRSPSNTWTVNAKPANEWTVNAKPATEWNVNAKPATEWTNIDATTNTDITNKPVAVVAVVKPSVATGTSSTWDATATAGNGNLWVFDFLAPPVTSAKLTKILADAVPGKDYPALTEIPATSFTCASKKRVGFYADVETNCQVFHRCDVDGVKTDYLCPEKTVFNQVTLNCDWWYNVDCANSPKFEQFANIRLYTDQPLFDTPPKEYVPKWVNLYYAQLHKDRADNTKRFSFTTV
ncbi:uncharacterized protein LOC129588638 [Paramacrobiotus metropolitanus]|uniref:uncharacterized protein LOC129588638 n=1 Tax=Paramacrobiotus metropolitanus TaxID=2943436 RepID=UPI002445D35F|nr:uncharacterized protein LOC129588638 [Paramacrobiotus metropolitanus]